MSENNPAIVDFWNHRTSRFRHTGWADGIIYAFDQPARLLAIDHIIAQEIQGRDAVLDFGTGSGDFANLLANMFSQVFASDISQNVIDVAQSMYGMKENIEFSCNSSASTLPIQESALDLILSITVLGHILDDDDLIETLKSFHRMLKPSGKIVAMEYTPLQEMTPSTYQKFRPYDEWINIFQDSGFDLVHCFGFYHPSEKPCNSYQKYRSHFLLKLLSKAPQFIKRSYFIRKFCQHRSTKILDVADDIWGDINDSDVLRIMLFQPQKDE